MTAYYTNPDGSVQQVTFVVENVTEVNNGNFVLDPGVNIGVFNQQPAMTPAIAQPVVQTVGQPVVQTVGQPVVQTIGQPEDQTPISTQPPVQVVYTLTYGEDQSVKTEEVFKKEEEPSIPENNSANNNTTTSIEHYLEQIDDKKLHEENTIVVYPSTSDDSNKVWSSPMVYALIEEYRRLVLQFRDPRTRQKKLWRSVSKALKQRGIHVTSEMCDRKWRNLKSTFKAIYYKYELQGSKQQPAPPPPPQPANPDGSELKKPKWEFYDELLTVFSPDIRTMFRKAQRPSRVVMPPRVQQVPYENDNNSENDTSKDAISHNLSETENDDKPLITFVGKKRKRKSVIEIDSDVEVDKEAEEKKKTLFLLFKNTITEMKGSLTAMKKAHDEYMKIEKRKNELLKELIKKLDCSDGEDNF